MIKNWTGDGQRRIAFTIIELLVALAIATLLTAIALPSLKEGMRTSSLSRSAGIVQGAFVNARAQAIRTGRPFGVVIERIRRSIGDGTADQLDFFAANYATRMYYVQSPIEYRGDTEDAVCYPVFETAASALLPGIAAPQFLVAPRIFFPQRSAGLLYAAAGPSPSLAAQNLLTAGTRFSLGDSGYVFEIERAEKVTGYTTDMVDRLTGASVFQFNEIGTLVDFNFVGTTPETRTQTGVYRPNNTLLTPAATQPAQFHEARFPGGIEPYQGISFRFLTNPIPAALAPVTLVGKSVIDLSISGPTEDPLAFGTQAIFDSTPGVDAPAMASNVQFNNIAVMFSPDGKVDSVYYDQRLVAGNTVTGFVPQRLVTGTTLAFNVGFVDGVLDNIDDGARFPEHIDGTDYQVTGNDFPLNDPQPPLALEVSQTPNFANTDCVWINIQPSSGAVTQVGVAGQPPPGVFSNYYGLGPVPGQSARDVMRYRLLQARKLASGGTVQ